MGAEPKSHGLAGKVNWIGLGPRRRAAAAKRAPIITFDHFLFFGSDGPSFLKLAPQLASRIYSKNVRVPMDRLDRRERVEVERLLALAKDAPPSSADAGACRGRGRGVESCRMNRMRGRHFWIPGNRASSWLMGIRGAGRTVLLAMLWSACTKPVDEFLWQASMRGQVDDMKRFLRQGADPNYVRGGHSILMRLARGGRGDIAEILIDSGAKVNFKGKDGASALTVAAEHGNTEVSRVLLAKGADVNIRNDHGNTALMDAAEYGHPEMVRLLLAAGADVTPRDRDGARDEGRGQAPRSVPAPGGGRAPWCPRPPHQSSGRSSSSV